MNQVDQFREALLQIREIVQQHARWEMNEDEAMDKIGAAVNDALATGDWRERVTFGPI
jgi:hypothetical protein